MNNIKKPDSLPEECLPCVRGAYLILSQLLPDFFYDCADAGAEA